MPTATVAEVPLQFRAKNMENAYAPYWENETTMNPTLVRFLSHEGEYFTVRLPDGHVKQVHCHHLGIFRH